MFNFIDRFNHTPPDQSQIPKQLGFAHLLLIILLLAGIAIGVYMIQFTQVFKSKAANDGSISSMTKELVAENSKLKQESVQSGMNQDSIIGSMASTSYTRKLELLKLAKENPMEFLKQATLADKAQDFPPAVQENLEKIVQEQGKIIHLHIDDFRNNKAQAKFYLEVKKDGIQTEKIDLIFAGGDAHILTGSQVSVKGVKVDNTLIVGSDTKMVHEIFGTKFDITSAAGAARVTNANVAFIMINFQDKPTEKPFTKEEILSTVLSSPNSVQKFYQEASANQMSFSANVFGWYTIPMSSSDECNSVKWAELGLEESRKAGADLTSYNYYSFIMPATLCGAIGHALIGGNYSWISFPTPAIIAHELGHNFGLNHADKLNCGIKSIDKYWNCKSMEYGDNYDVMGSTNHLFNAPHDIALGWLPTNQVQTINQNGIYKIAPLKKAGLDTKVLKIAKKDTYEFSQNQNYFLEYRQPFGIFDSSFESESSPNNIVKGVSIRIWNENPGSQTHLIDLTPGDNEGGPDSPPQPEALADNQLFTDPVNGISIKQLSHDANGAIVEVKFFPGISTLISASPSQVKGGESVTINVSNIINPSSTYWVGIYSKYEQDNTKFLDWFYLGSCSKTPGTEVFVNPCAYVMPNETNGPPGVNYSYQFRLFSNSSYDLINHSNDVNVTPNFEIQPSPTPNPYPTTAPISGGPNFNNSTQAYCTGSVVSRIHVQWDGVTGANYYQIYRRGADSGGNWVKIGDTSNIAMNDETVNPGSQYYYAIRAVLADRQVDGNTVSAIAAKCQYFSNTPVSGGPNFNNSTLAYCAGSGGTPRIHLQWNSVPDAVVYNIQRNTDQPNSRISIGQTSGIAYNDERIVTGTDYSYTVVATVQQPGKPESFAYGNDVILKAPKCP